MKNKILKLGIIITLITTLFILTGCGKSNNADNNKQSNTTEQEVNKQEATTLVEKISANNYGDSINYSANGIDDWKIFYNDGENVFIITSKLIPNSKVPDSIGIESRKNRYLKNYNVIWDWDSNEFTKYAGTSSIDKTLAEKYQLSWIKNHPEDTDHKNMKVVASLFDKNNWSNFIDSNYAESAIGSPTLEMFINSWNEKHPDSKLYYSIENENGYCIGTEENPETSSIRNLTGLKEDKLYNIVPEEFGDDGMGMTLAAPNMYGTDRVCKVDDVRVSFRDPFSSYDGVRPIVCLKANVNAIYEDGTWKLEGNNETNQDANEVIGEWKATKTSDDNYSLGYIYGTSISMNNSLKLNSDGTYTLYLGFTFAQKGNYKIDGTTINLTNNEYIGDSPEHKIAQQLTMNNNQLLLQEETDNNTEVNIIFEK